MALLNMVFAGSGFELSNVTAFQLLIAGGLLLAIAVFLLAWTRERRVSVKSSAVTDEIAVYLGRIAHALENAADPAVKKWSAAQNTRARRYLDQRETRPFVRDQLERLLANTSPNYSSLVWRAG